MYYGRAFHGAYNGSSEFKKLVEEVVTNLNEYERKDDPNYNYHWGMIICEWPELSVEMIKRASAGEFMENQIGYDRTEVYKNCIASIVEWASEMLSNILGIKRYGAKFITRVEFNQKSVIISFNNGMKFELSADDTSSLYLMDTVLCVDANNCREVEDNWLLNILRCMFGKCTHRYELGFNASDMFSDILDLSCEYVVDKGEE